MNHSTKPLTVAVILVNWNGFDDTVECIESLQTIDSPQTKIIVVDNGSANDEAERLLARYPDVRVIRNVSNEGFARACNTGITEALGLPVDYLLLLNNDTIVNSDFLALLVKHVESEDVPTIASPLISLHPTDRIWSAGGWLNRWSGLDGHVGKSQPMETYQAKPPYPVDYVSGCALLASVDVFRQVGLLDPHYFVYWEDVDFCWRARAAGCQLHIVPSSRIAHKQSASAGLTGHSQVTTIQARFSGRNAVIFAWKNLHGLSRFSFILGVCTLRLAVVVLRRESWLTVWEYLRGLIRVRAKVTVD